MSERSLVQLHLDKMEMSQLATLASIGAAFVHQCQQHARNDHVKSAQAGAACVQMAALAMKRFEDPTGYTWDRWMSIVDRIEKLQRAAFPEAPPYKVHIP